MDRLSFYVYRLKKYPCSRPIVMVPNCTDYMFLFSGVNHSQHILVLTISFMLLQLTP